MRDLFFGLSASVLLMIVNSAPAYAQRCAGDVTYVLRNQSGKIMDTETVAFRYLKRNMLGGPDSDVTVEPSDQGPDRLMRFHDETRSSTPDKPGDQSDAIKVLHISTGCGMRLVEVVLEHDNDTMLLRFLNVPMELNFWVDSVPFQNGIYEIDFKEEMKLRGQVLEWNGLVTKGDKQVLRSDAGAGHLVSAKNWKRTSPKSPPLSQLSQPASVTPKR